MVGWVNRMPVILPLDLYDAWLEPDNDRRREELLSMLTSYSSRRDGSLSGEQAGKPSGQRRTWCARAGIAAFLHLRLTSG